MFSLFTKAVKRWWNADPQTNGAAIAYYSLFSLAPTILIFVVILGRFFGAAAVQGKLNSAIMSFVGRDAAHLIEALLSFAYDSGNKSILTALISTVVVIFGALALFSQLQNALADIWRAEGNDTVVTRTYLRAKVVSVIVVIILGALLVASFLIGAFATLLMQRINPSVVALGSAINLGNTLISSLYVLVLFMFMYRYLPPHKASWYASFVGGVTGGMLFIIGRFLLGFYITAHVASSVYGAGGAAILVLIWFYYSAQIFFFGAALTFVVDQRAKLRQTSDI